MKSRTTSKFWKYFYRLPKEIQEQARNAYGQFQKDPGHPSLRFKVVHEKLPIYSVRITKNYRAVGQKESSTIIWFWIGTHADYDKLISQMKS